jgi:hypothetical protein
MISKTTTSQPRPGVGSPIALLLVHMHREHSTSGNLFSKSLNAER